MERGRDPGPARADGRVGAGLRRRSWRRLSTAVAPRGRDRALLLRGARPAGGRRLGDGMAYGIGAGSCCSSTARGSVGGRAAFAPRGDRRAACLPRASAGGTRPGSDAHGRGVSRRPRGQLARRRAFGLLPRPGGQPDRDRRPRSAGRSERSVRLTGLRSAVALVVLVRALAARRVSGSKARIVERAGQVDPLAVGDHRVVLAELGTRRPSGRSSTSKPKVRCSGRAPRRRRSRRSRSRRRGSRRRGRCCQRTSPVSASSA